MSLRCLHTADLHLDWAFDKMPPQQRAIRSREVAARLKTIADLAVEQRVQVLLVAGDLFDTPDVAAATAAYAAGIFAELEGRGIRVALIPGNHDPVVPGSVWESQAFPPNVCMFRASEWRHVEIIDGLHMYGIPFIPALAGEPVLRRLELVPSSGYHVALLHGQFLEIEGGSHHYYPFVGADMAASGLDYLALGHVHRPLALPPAGRTQSWYPGSPTRFTFRNLQERQVVLVELAGGQVQCQPLFLPDRPYLQLPVAVDTTPAEGIGQTLAAVADPEACVQVVLKGGAEAGRQSLAEAILQDWGHQFFFLEVVDHTRPLDEGEDTAPAE